MSKKSIIGLFLIILLIFGTSILFGVVFCLREQTVKVVGDSPISVSREDIIETAGFKNGDSIFMLDKEKAINNIEAKFSHIKVVQIKTISITRIEICVRARHEMFYVDTNDKFYVIDEDLKVLEILEKTAEEPTNLTRIETGNINIPSTTMKCDFIGTANQRKATYNLFVAMTSVVTKVSGDEIEYLSREDIRNQVQTIKIEEFETFSKLIITTSYGVILDIENPEKEMQDKINICFSSIKQFILDGNDKEKSGVIKIYYNANNTFTSIYIPDEQV